MQVSRERIHGAATAAHRHTRELVDASCSPDDCAAVCRGLAREIDDALAAATQAGTPVACAAGCDFCCHLRVSVFQHEAVAILHHLRTRLAQADAAAAERRIVENAARIDHMTVSEHYAARMPCALLVEGR